MADQFRLRSKDDPLGAISVPKMLRSTVRHGEVHASLLVPHIIIPLYGFYRLFCSLGYWPHHLAPLGELLLAILQGASLGGALVFGYLRFGKAGRTLKARRDAGAATPGEENAQKKLQLSFSLSCYILLGT